MTNKEKYPNAEVKSLYGEYYVSLNNKDRYLVRGEIKNHCSDGYHRTRESAQAALDKFMESPNPTLSEIKSQLAEAKKLIGKKFTNTHNNVKDTCTKVSLSVELSHENSVLVNGKITKNGYCIGVKTDGGYHFPFSICKEDKSIQLSSQYTAELVGNYWKIGNVEVSKDFVQHMYDFLSRRVAAKIVFEDVTFDLDMVKKLLES